MSKEFLPQFAAAAVADLTRTVEGFASSRITHPTTDHEHLKFFHIHVAAIASLLRFAVHVVLPVNGEVYRSNDAGGDIPNKDEIQSFVGIPAPVVAFEYPWSYKNTSGTTDAPKKRICLLVDFKQVSEMHDEAADALMNELDENEVQLFSLWYSVALRSWICNPYAVVMPQPLDVKPCIDDDGKHSWSVHAYVKDLLKDPRSSYLLAHEDAEGIGNMRSDLTAAIQCCHSLRAKAELLEVSEKSSSRKRKFNKKGVGGFEYHVLKIPYQHGSGGHHTDGGGTHATPRLHIRRSHIRKLPTGTFTFVRQCFVGDPDKGVVEKNYEVKK